LVPFFFKQKKAFISQKGILSQLLGIKGRDILINCSLLDLTRKGIIWGPSYSTHYLKEGLFGGPWFNFKVFIFKGIGFPKLTPEVTF